MRVSARIVINGMTVAGSETWGWEVAGDGRYDTRLPPVASEELERALRTPASYVGVQIELHGLATVRELESRLRGVERALDERYWQSFARDVGLWLPRAE